MSSNPGGTLAGGGGGGGPTDKGGWSYKHQDLMNLTAVRRVVDLNGEDCTKDCFAMVCRTNEVFDLDWPEVSVKAVKKQQKSKRQRRRNRRNSGGGGGGGGEPLVDTEVGGKTAGLAKSRLLTVNSQNIGRDFGDANPTLLRYRVVYTFSGND